MALSMLAQIDPSQREAGARARRIARMLEDEELAGTVERRLRQSAAKQ
jgi:hypothetical protein